MKIDKIFFLALGFEQFKMSGNQTREEDHKRKEGNMREMED